MLTSSNDGYHNADTSVAVEVLGASTRVGHRSVHTAFLHVVTPGYYVGVMLAI